MGLKRATQVHAAFILKWKIQRIQIMVCQNLLSASTGLWRKIRDEVGKRGIYNNARVACLLCNMFSHVREK